MAHAPYDEDDDDDFDMDDELYKIFTNVLCDLVDKRKGITRYIHDQALTDEIQQALIGSDLVDDDKSYDDDNMEDLIEHVKKEKNGAWEIQLGNDFENRLVYIGFEIEIPEDYYDDEGYAAMVDLLKSCPRQVRDIVDRERRARERARNQNNNNYNNNNNGDEKKDNDDESDSENDYYDEQIELCPVCGKPCSVTPPFDRHICRVKASFRCHNPRCKATWSTVRGFLDPETQNVPENGESYCKYCNHEGIMTNYHFEKKSQASGEHLRDLCGACRRWGDCRGLFLQVATIGRALQEVYQCEIEIEMMQDEENQTNYFEVSFHDNSDTRYIFYVNPYVNILS